MHERSRDWRAAVDVAARLENRGNGSFASRIAHYWCELALEADARHLPDEADQALARAREAAPQAARPLVLAGHAAARRGDHAEALSLWGALMVTHPGAFNLVAREYATSALACDEGSAARERLLAAYQRAPTLDLLDAIALIDADPVLQRARLVEHLHTHPSLSATHVLLAGPAPSPMPRSARCAMRSAAPRSPCIAIAVRPAASRPSTTTGNARAA